MNTGNTAIGRASMLKLGALGAVSGAISWAILNYSEQWGIDFKVEGDGILLIPFSVFPGVVFGVIFAAVLVLARRTDLRRGLGYILASTVGYVAAFHLAFNIISNLSHGGDSFIAYVVGGVPAGFLGSLLLGLAARFLFPLGGRAAFRRSIVIGALAGALLCLGKFDDHNGWGWLAFFVLWQGLYGASLSPFFLDRAR